MTAATSDYVLGIDIGGTKTAAALVDNDRIVAREQVETARTGRGADIVEAIAGLA